MEMTVKEVLIAARAKIADPANWTKHRFATDVYGVEVASTHKTACRFCAVGALRNVAGGVGPSLYAESVLSRVVGGLVSLFNDTHAHAEVLSKFDEAIAAQGGE